MRKCFYCDYNNPDDARFCEKCGEKLEGTKCPQCGCMNTDESMYCESCGKALKLSRQIAKVSDSQSSKVVIISKEKSEKNFHSVIWIVAVISLILSVILAFIFFNYFGNGKFKFWEKKITYDEDNFRPYMIQCIGDVELFNGEGKLIKLSDKVVIDKNFKIIVGEGSTAWIKLDPHMVLMLDGITHEFAAGGVSDDLFYSSADTGGPFYLTNPVGRGLVYTYIDTEYSDHAMTQTCGDGKIGIYGGFSVHIVDGKNLEFISIYTGAADVNNSKIDCTLVEGECAIYGQLNGEEINKYGSIENIWASLGKRVDIERMRRTAWNDFTKGCKYPVELGNPLY